MTMFFLEIKSKGQIRGSFPFVSLRVRMTATNRTNTGVLHCVEDDGITIKMTASPSR